MSNLEWIVAVGAGLIAPFLLVTTVGYSLPRRQSVSRSIVLRQNPRSVWETITAFERIPGWWPACVMVERVLDRKGHPVYRLSFLNSRNLRALDLEVAESKELSRLVTWRVGAEAPFQGQWIYDLKPVDGGCQLNLTEQIEIANPFIRTMFRLKANKTQFIDNYLVCLGRKFGEEVLL